MKIVAKPILGGDQINLDDAWIVEFGEGEHVISVGFTRDVDIGDIRIDVRSPRGRAILLEPQSGNSVWVSVKVP